MKRIIRLIPVVTAALVSISASAQSASEIAAAKSMAHAYGYTDSEINAVLNHNIGGSSASASSSSAPASSSSAPASLSSAPAPAPAATPAPAAAVVAPVTEVTVIEAAEEPVAIDQGDIYGHTYLTSSGLSIIPSYNAPVPAAYILGPGDELIIDIWGATVSHVAATVGNDGSISISDLGPVYLSGMTLSKAEDFLREQLGRIYSGLSGNNPDTFMRLSIAKIKGVSINVSGEVATPGLYSIPSLATIPSVIYMAGGVRDRGSVRNISLYRHGSKIADFDLYDFLFKGRFNENLRIQDGDVITVAAYNNVVSITGAVARPMRYEIVEGETVRDLIAYADGFTLGAQKTEVNVYRRGVLGNKSIDVPEADFASFKLRDGDRVSVRSYSALDQNTVTIAGPLKYPGSYAIGDSVTDVASLVAAAGGLMDGAYTERGQIRRLDKDRLPVFITFNLNDVLSGKTVVELEREDAVTLYRKSDFIERKNVTIEGHVIRPGSYDFSEGMTLTDLILEARGVREDVYADRALIQRIAADGTPVILTFNVESALSGEVNIPLQRDDRVRIFSTREFIEQKNVTIEGHVIRPGSYDFSEGMTLTDLILEARGVREDVYGNKAIIRRIAADGTPVILTFNVESALSGEVNIPLQRDDRVRIFSIRELREDATVTVGGFVKNGGTFPYYEGMTLEDLILTGGNFANGADMRNIQIAHRGGRERGSVDIVDVENNPEMLQFQLAPYDVVSVRRLTYFRDQITITVNGEVITPGPYTFHEAEVRLSDVMSRVGGFTDEAYLHGANLTRVLTPEERERQRIAVQIANQSLGQKDTINPGVLLDRFHIGIDLEKAIEKPGSVFDVTLRSGDVIEIPILNNTVKVTGGVFYPNTVAFDKAAGWKDYVHQAGGFTKTARKHKTYAVYMNGKVAVGNQIKTEPGMELVIPERKENEAPKMSPVEIAALASSTTSIATMVVSIIKLIM